MVNILVAEFGKETTPERKLSYHTKNNKLAFSERAPRRRKRRRHAAEDTAIEGEVPEMIESLPKSQLGKKIGDYFFKWYLQHWEFFLMTERNHGYATSGMSESHFAILKSVYQSNGAVIFFLNQAMDIGKEET